MYPGTQTILYAPLDNTVALILRGEVTTKTPIWGMMHVSNIFKVEMKLRDDGLLLG